MPRLDREDLRSDATEQFAAWWDEAENVPLREAMTLATTDGEGSPDARMVLLKGFDESGFRFFTNYESVKGRQLDTIAHGALVIYWRELDRQVRIRGPVERLGDEESDAYFASRARDSQLGAWASPQSRPLVDRADLDRRRDEVVERFGDEGEVARPEQWGGYMVRHETVEFWQGQVGRLHDRFLYRRGEGDWRIERLGP
ncbi:pyridoxamine 5'-phosphate oxidase [soil metagenome]